MSIRFAAHPGSGSHGEPSWFTPPGAEPSGPEPPGAGPPGSAPGDSALADPVVASYDRAPATELPAPCLPAPRSPVPRQATSLWRQAQDELAEADPGRDPGARFVASYLAAHRAAAAILAARGRPHRGRARPESVWRLLESAAPELEQWAAFFAARSARYAAARAGNSRRITSEAVAELVAVAREFVALAHRVVYPVAGPVPATTGGIVRNQTGSRQESGLDA